MWKDNKIVTLLSTYIGSHQVNSIDRYDKKITQKIKIPCPKAVSEYNSNMGGVDSMDSFIGQYHNRIKSCKWYLRIVYHLIDMTVINAYLLYKKTCNVKNVENKNVLNMSDFHSELAETLCCIGNKTSERGRPSSSSLELDIQAKKTQRAWSVHSTKGCSHRWN